VLVVTQALTCLWHLVVNPLFLVRKTGYLPVVMAGAAAVSVALNLLLIPSIGLVGAAVAVLGANVLLTMIVAVISIHFYPIRYDYGRMALAAIVAVLIFYLAGGLELDSPAETLGAKVLAVASYPGLLLVLRVLDPAELRQLWVSLRGRGPVNG
jgi:O-antigen/teichoic acid export membrane protein